MGTKIIYNGQIIAFKCDKKRRCSKSTCKPGWCERTTEIEHAVFDGEKTFERSGGIFMEEI